MQLSNITIIVIRLFVLNSILNSIVYLVSAYSAALAGADLLIVLAVPLIGIIVLSLLWYFAPTIAWIASSGADAHVEMPSLNRYDLYSFAFVFLGLYFVLASIADVINWLHFFATLNHESARPNPRVQNLYQLTRPLVTLTAGLISLFGASHWAKKLIRYEQNHSSPSRATPPRE